MATLERIQTPNFDPETPITKHEGLAAAMYHEHFAALGPDAEILNVAAGQTNLEHDLALGSRRDRRVISLDPQYVTDRPLYRVGIAEALPFDADSFDLTMCQFGLQHMYDRPSAIREMVRVTRSAADADDRTKGTIILNPVFINPITVHEGLAARGLDSIARVEITPARMRGSTKDVLPSLIIRKTPDLTPAKLEALIELTETTKALANPRRTTPERIERFLRRNRQARPML